MEVLGFWGFIIFAILIYSFIKFLKDSISGKNTSKRKLPSLQNLPNTVNSLNRSDFIEVIRQYKENLGVFLKKVDYKGRGESYKITYESQNYIVVKSYSDDTYMEIISITDKKTNEKFFA